MSPAAPPQKLRRVSALGLAVAFTAFTCVALALFAILIGHAWRQNLDRTRVALVKEDAASLADIFDLRGPETLATVINARVTQQKLGISILLLTDASLRPLAGNLPQWPPEVPRANGFYTLELRQPDRLVHAHVSVTQLAGGYHLLAGRDLGRDRARFELEHLFWIGLAGAAATALVLGGIGGLLTRRMLLAEVRRINETAAAIMEGDLTRRLPVTGRTSEPELLAQNVNRMLDQIEQLVNGVKDVSNAIAHDLRTPLAELRARLEMLLVTRPSADETMLEIESAVADVDRVIGIFNALLRLAEIETGARRARFVRVDVADVARDAVDFYQPLAENREITLDCDCESDVTMSGDAVLLAQAVGNLIDNALKHTPGSGAVRVHAARRDDVVRLSVADNGPGVAQEELPKLTERFYRADRSRGTPGVGLGLTLVSAVAALHRGRLELVDNAPGLRATLVLPVA